MIFRCLTLCLLSILATTAQGEAYKCRTPDGRVEFSNLPCSGGASTLGVRPDDKVSPEERARAQREADQQRAILLEKEAAARAAQDSGPAGAAIGGSASGNKTAGGSPSQDMVDSCLRDLDRQVMDAARRAEMEAACRSRGTAPGSESIPVYATGGGNSVITRCLNAVARMNLSAQERARQQALCQGTVLPTTPQTTGSKTETVTATPAAGLCMQPNQPGCGTNKKAAAVVIETKCKGGAPCPAKAAQ